MKFADTSERGLETIIVESLINDAGYVQGDSVDFDHDHALDWKKLSSFVAETQKKAYEDLRLDEEGHHRTQFLHRLQGEIAKRGVIDVLRMGIRHNQHAIDLFYGCPSEENVKAKELYEENIFSVIRQLRYSKNETQLSLDIAIFINGLPLATFELKNKLTKQTVADAIQQYKRDRDPKELLFQFGRCAVHFAVDDYEVWMCTHLKGKHSWFLPFNKGYMTVPATILTLKE